ncbi:MAG: RNA polymerase sigma factor SigW [Ignavibacteriae bacterium]|nr:MAG: RNA polymerase sigma factor SigW [Ignavibacteriota bacterium]
MPKKKNIPKIEDEQIINLKLKELKLASDKIESRKEDIALVNQALRGNQAAYEKLMKKYKSTISFVLLRIIQDKNEVEDIVQEVFINTFKSLKTYKKQYSFFSWIYKIAMNKGIDYLRKKKLQTFSIDKPIKTKDGDLHFELPDSTYEPDKQLIASERAALVHWAIEQLPAKYKKVIIMRHQEEKDYAEIAKELKLPIGTVKVHIFRARELLNKYLKNRIRHY